MNRLAASTLVLVLAASGVAQADPPARGGFEPQRHAEHQGWQARGGEDRRGWSGGPERHDGYGQRDGRDMRDARDWHERHDWRGGYYGYSGPRYGYPLAPRYYDYRHDYRHHGDYGHRWARGQWLPAEYRTRYYYVPDYWRYGQRVYAPPVGCRWVRYDGDLVLTALATGLVLDVIYDAYD